MRKLILLLLETHPEGLTIKNLSDETGAHRQTVTKYVVGLVGEGDVERRRVGSATLHYLTDEKKEGGL